MHLLMLAVMVRYCSVSVPAEKDPGEEVPVAQAPNGNGQIAHECEWEKELEEEPTTHRMDNWKGKASHEELATILDPTFTIDQEEREDNEQ